MRPSTNNAQHAATPPGRSRAPRRAGADAPPTPERATSRSKAVGDYGERLAERRLVAGGLTLLDRNFTDPSGEIDLVLRDGDTLVVCEVKTRSSEVGGSPLEAVDEEKVSRLRRLAAVWLAAHPGVRPDGIRIDLVGIRLPRRGAPIIDHVCGVG